MTVSRATLPAEFFDITSAQLLIQPEPQYIHARLAKMGLSISLEDDASLGLPIPGRQFGTTGQPYANVNDGRLELEREAMLGSAVTVVPEFGNESVGHVVRINRPAFVNSTYTQASREVPSGTTISTTGINLSSEQVSLTIKRFAGPYDNGQTKVAPLAIDRFDSGRSIHKMNAIKNMTLARDFDRWLDSVMISLFDLGSTVLYPRGFAADTDFKTAGDGPFEYSLISRAQSTLDNANVPTFPNGNRMMVISPDQAQQLNDDRQFIKMAQDNPMFSALFNGIYFKTVSGFDIFKSTQLTKTAGPPAVRYAQAFGPGMVGLGAGGQPRTAFNTQDNFGETALVVWLWYAAFGALDNRFGVSIHTD